MKRCRDLTKNDAKSDNNSEVSKEHVEIPPFHVRSSTVHMVRNTCFILYTKKCDSYFGDSNCMVNTLTGGVYAGSRLVRTKIPADSLQMSLFTLG